jgi:integrase
VSRLSGTAGSGSASSRYVRTGKCKADHASAALGKWLKKDFNGLTAHCLRHTFKDRLRAVECPLEIIDQIGGWSSISSIGSSYWMGYELKTRKSI